MEESIERRLSVRYADYEEICLCRRDGDGWEGFEDSRIRVDGRILSSRGSALFESCFTASEILQDAGPGVLEDEILYMLPI